MSVSEVMDLLREAVGVAIKLGGPMLLLSMTVGVIVAIFQAVTQIHEQTIGFILKVLVILAVLLMGGGHMLDTLLDFTRRIFLLIAS